MKCNYRQLIQSVQRILIGCLVVSSMLGIWGCAGDQDVPAVSSPTDSVLPTTSFSSAEPTPTPFISDGEEPGATLDPQQTEPSFTLRGIWVQRRAVVTQEKADEMLARVEAGNFNAIFLLVFAGGYAYYDSAILEKDPELAPGYDPLAYVVTQAHRAGLQVHAWFPAGDVGYSYMEPGPILSNHPEWGMVGPDGGSQVHWLNFARPDARQFMGDVILEVVQSYDVDGIHLDYIRYPGPNWSFDSYSVGILASEYGVDIERLRGARLPAYGRFQGNPLSGVETAEVLAEFDDGTPAVILNKYGAGEVIVLNWEAQRQEVAVASEILRRSLNYLLGEEGSVYILRSETAVAQYGLGCFRRGRAWLQSLEWEPHQVTEADDLSALEADSVLVLPNVYVMEKSTADELRGFVENGGGLVFVDGPVRSMKYAPIRAITGMQGRARYFEGEKTILAVGESELIPSGGPPIDLQVRQDTILTWNAFREESVNTLVRDVYSRVKAIRPEVQVSAAVFRKRSWGANVFQDWYAWLPGGYVDFVVPMAYVGIDAVSSLESLVDEWEADGIRDGMAVGISVADFSDQDKALKASTQLLLELDLLKRRGTNKVVIFDEEHISDEHLAALAQGPFVLSSY